MKAGVDGAGLMGAEIALVFKDREERSAGEERGNV